MSHPRPLIIGVVGGSGSGKTTVARAIHQATGLDAAFVDQDAYYQDLAHLTLEERRQVNFDHPDALDNDLMVAQLEQLAAGEAIEKPTYDYARHTRAEQTERVEPASIVIVDGILLFTDARLRELFDIKLYVDVADDVRFIRRLQRDVEERGRAMDDVIHQYLTTVRPMHLEFVEPSKRHADVILPEGGHNRIGVAMVIARVRLELQQRRVQAE
ncbi:MAG: uridine kinase [Gemmatimonadales bacterium]|nr:uridine kinase [Gemmatimonadales bacterium]MDZ4391265.1 uridine kinase [Gemmatimonadales bacterium]